MFGKKHQALAAWLADEWWSKGPPVCVISGFPGTGKTEIAIEAMNAIKRARPELPVAFLNCVESKSAPTDDFLLAITEALAAEGDSEPLERLERGEDVAAIFNRLLVPPRLIVADEAQRLFIGSTGAMPSATALFLERWSQTVGANGRLLLVASREFDLGRWKGRVEVQMIGPLEPNEAEAFFHACLEESGRTENVPRERIADVVAWLGYNPRVIKLLVSALRRESLDNLIGLAPEAWEARDRPISLELLREFEREILTRAEEGLEIQARIFLSGLSVFRQPADRRALESLCPQGIEMAPLRNELVDRYMLELRRNRYEMHSVLRDAVRARLTDADRRHAHLAAGRYYAAPFRARRALGPAEKLGARFIEARYHFTLGESQSDLDDISARFEAHYRTQFGLSTVVPTDAEELDERIALLSALLQARGAKGLEYHLARCLVRRNRPGDSGRALPHARRATGPQAPDDTWVLRLQLEEREFGAGQAMKVAREALASLPVEQSQKVYLLAGEFLARDGRPDEAIELLRQGIKGVRPEYNVVSLYELAAEILARNGKQNEAIELLLQGAASIPDSRQAPLMEHAILHAFAANRLEVLPIATFDAKQSTFLAIIAALAQDNLERAAHLGDDAHIRAEDNKAIFAQTAFAWLSLGEPAKADEALGRFSGQIPDSEGSPLTWLRAFIKFELGSIEEAHILLKVCLGASHDTNDVVDRPSLLRLWDSSRWIAFYFPRLTPRLTGLTHTIVRRQHGGSVLTEEELQAMSTFTKAPPAEVISIAAASFAPERVIIAMQPDRCHGLYILGCYDKTKTVYVQQCRALTLIHALFRAGELRPGSRLGIVGGGAAGVTAAAAAACKGAKVTLFERARDLLPLQRQNTKRYLHPHLFDWPARGSTDTRAELPLLDWTADRSNVVAAQIVGGFHEVSATTANIDLRLGVGVQNVERISSTDETRRIQLLAAEGEISEIFDVAIIAVGFGLERRNRLGIDNPPYWEDDGLDQVLGASPERPQRVLISGAGDGALIDLLRASIRDFRHEDILEMLPEGNALLKLQDALRAIESDAKQASLTRDARFVNLQQRYSALTLAPAFLNRVRGRIRDDTEVWFNYESAGRYTLGSAVLNRFLVYALGRLGVIKPKLAKLDEKSVTRQPSGEYAVAWRKGAASQIFDRVFIRHGPPTNYLAEIFPELEDACAPLRGKLSDLNLTGTLDRDTRAYFAQ